MAQKLRTISRCCNRCGKPLSAIIDDDGDPKIVDGDAVAVCTNAACNYQDDEVAIDRSDVKSRWQVEP